MLNYADYDSKNVNSTMKTLQSKFYFTSLILYLDNEAK